MVASKPSRTRFVYGQSSSNARGRSLGHQNKCGELIKARLTETRCLSAGTGRSIHVSPCRSVAPVQATSLSSEDANTERSPSACDGQCLTRAEPVVTLRRRVIDPIRGDKAQTDRTPGGHTPARASTASARALPQTSAGSDPGHASEVPLLLMQNMALGLTLTAIVEEDSDPHAFIPTPHATPPSRPIPVRHVRQHTTIHRDQRGDHRTMPRRRGQRCADV
jgi:hypothetical protein